jgi:hypothetical protein
MVAVPDAAVAAAWYAKAVGAVRLWDLGSVVGMEIDGAPFFLAEPANNKWATPASVGTTTVRIEVFVDDPDSFVARRRGRCGRPPRPGATIRRRGARIGKADSSIPSGTSGWSATRRRFARSPDAAAMRWRSRCL